MQSKTLRSIADKKVRRTFKILREVWLDIGIEKVDIYEGVTVKALLDSGEMRMFMNKKTAKKYDFRLQKLERPLIIRNVDEIGNSGGNIIYQVKVNVFYKNHVERMRIDMCNLGRMKVILGMS